VLITATIIYINQRIFAFDLRYHFGKDGGYLSRVKSICIMSTVFFAVMAEKRRFLLIISGFFTGVAVSIFWYVAMAFLFPIDIEEVFAITFHALASLSFMGLFFYFENKILKIPL
jgi:hypothetical protein